MPVSWTPLVEIAQKHRRFLLTTHVRPDGDGLGSMLALADTLRQRDRVVDLVVASKIPPRYDFLDPERRLKRFSLPGEEYRGAEVVVVLDTGAWNQLGEMGPFLKSHTGPKLVIDHHVTQDDLGAIPLVDTSAEATGRLVYEAIEALGGPLGERAAQSLFVALAMDTGWFRHSNTTPATFELASRLTRAGAQPTIVYDLLFEQNSLPRLRLIGAMLGRMRVLADGQVACSEVHRSDYEATGAAPQDSEDLVNYTRSVAGVEVGVLLLEQPAGGVKISLRARSRVDVAALAQQFGGGGHRLAAGAVLDTSLADARARVLSAVEKALPKQE